MLSPEPYCDHGPLDACRCLAALPVWKLPAAEAPANRAEWLAGVRIQPTLRPDDQPAAIVQDDDGKFLGYVVQAEIDRVRNLPDPETIRRQAERIMQLMILGPRSDSEYLRAKVKQAEQMISVGQPAPAPEPGTDAENMHVYAHEFDPIGGFVCAECGMPTESEPCKEHQPIAYSKMT